MSHTKEPWRLDCEDPAMIEDSRGIHICSVQKEDDAIRIIECINACAGLDTEHLNQVVRNPLSSYRELMQQRNELLEVLSEIDSCAYRDIYGSTIESARKAIANAKGNHHE